MINSKKIYKQGYILLTAVIFFVLAGSAITYGIANSAIHEATIVKDVEKATTSYYVSDAGVEDVSYRLKNNLSVSNTENLTVGDNTAITSIISDADGKTVHSEGTSNNGTRKIEVKLINGVGASFNYGIQTGQGGFNLTGGARVNGNVYANGNIVATNGVVITGSAIAASASALVRDQSNNSPDVPTSSIDFRNSSSAQDLAQSFKVSSTSPIISVQFYIKKTGSPSDATVEIMTDSGGNPGTQLTYDTLYANQVTTSYGWVDVTFSNSNPTLTANTTYWLVIHNSSNNSKKYYTVGANNTYSNGVAKVGQLGGSWTNTNLDTYFTVSIGGQPSTIGGSTYVGGVNIGTGGTGDAWAHNVIGASVSGDLYCQTGSYNNKDCDTSRPDPSPEPMPVSDGNIQAWKDDASTGGTITGPTSCPGGYSGGNCIVDWHNATFGPGVISGSLTVEGGGILTLSGNVWVQGNITVTGGGQVKLASSYGLSSGVLMADGTIILEGGGALTGSGQTGSYLLILSNKSCPVSGSCSSNPSIDVSGGAGAVILNAQKGAIKLEGGSNIKEATAYLISADGGATITYERGLENPNFNTGPSGGYNFSTWNEVQ